MIFSSHCSVSMIIPVETSFNWTCCGSAGQSRQWVSGSVN